VNTVRVREAAVTMSMVDGDVLTPQQMARIVAAVCAELRRAREEEASRASDTRVAASGDRPGHDGGSGS
jgi:hypothetical protein